MGRHHTPAGGNGSRRLHLDTRSRGGASKRSRVRLPLASLLLEAGRVLPSTGRRSTPPPGAPSMGLTLPSGGWPGAHPAVDVDPGPALRAASSSSRPQARGRAMMAPVASRGTPDSAKTCPHASHFQLRASDSGSRAKQGAIARKRNRLASGPESFARDTRPPDRKGKRVARQRHPLAHDRNPFAHERRPPAAGRHPLAARRIAISRASPGGATVCR